RWRRQIDGPAHGEDSAQAIAVAPSGNVVVGGLLVQAVQNTATRGYAFWVSLLSGADGTELWRYTRAGSARGAFDRVAALALDAAGDVYATGGAGAPAQQLVTVKLSGATGAELWRRSLSGTTSTSMVFDPSLALTPSGDVIVGGKLDNLGTYGDAMVAK